LLLILISIPHPQEPILKILRVWSEWCLFPQEQLRAYYDTFLDTSKPPPKVTVTASGAATTFSSSSASSGSTRLRMMSAQELEEIDGVPMTEEGMR
jgi:hypothetical protein